MTHYCCVHGPRAQHLALRLLLPVAEEQWDAGRGVLGRGHHAHAIVTEREVISVLCSLVTLHVNSKRLSS